MIKKTDIKFTVAPEDPKQPDGIQIVTAKILMGEAIRVSPEELAVHRTEVLQRTKRQCAIRLWERIFGPELRDQINALRMTYLKSWHPGMRDEDLMRQEFNNLFKLIDDPSPPAEPKLVREMPTDDKHRTAICPFCHSGFTVNATHILELQAAPADSETTTVLISHPDNVMDIEVSVPTGWVLNAVPSRRKPTKNTSPSASTVTNAAPRVEQEWTHDNNALVAPSGQRFVIWAKTNEPTTDAENLAAVIKAALAAERQRTESFKNVGLGLERQLAAEREKREQSDLRECETEEKLLAAQAAIKPLVEALEWYAQGTLMTKVAKDALAKVKEGK